MEVNTKKTLKSTKKMHTLQQEPQKLSAIGEWRRKNRGGIAIVLDRRAVNK